MLQQQIISALLRQKGACLLASVQELRAAAVGDLTGEQAWIIKPVTLSHYGCFGDLILGNQRWWWGGGGGVMLLSHRVRIKD